MPDENLTLTVVALGEASAGVVGAKYVLRLQSPRDQFWFVADWQFQVWKLFEDSNFEVDWAAIEQDLRQKGAATCSVRGRLDFIRILLEGAKSKGKHEPAHNFEVAGPHDEVIE